MSPFINRRPFYPQTSLEKLPRTAPPLNKFPSSKTAPPLPETTLHALTSLTSPFYKSHVWPRIAPEPSSSTRAPQPAWQFGPAINFALQTWDFSHKLSLWAAFFLTPSADQKFLLRQEADEIRTANSVRKNTVQHTQNRFYNLLWQK
jgi:hypothetical protein